VSGTKSEERAKEKTRNAVSNDALAFSQILIWLLPNTSQHLPHTSFMVIKLTENTQQYEELKDNILITCTNTVLVVPRDAVF